MTPKERTIQKTMEALGVVGWSLVVAWLAATDPHYFSNARTLLRMIRRTRAKSSTAWRRMLRGDDYLAFLDWFTEPDNLATLEREAERRRAAKLKMVRRQRQRRVGNAHAKGLAR